MIILIIVVICLSFALPPGCLWLSACACAILAGIFAFFLGNDLLPIALLALTMTLEKSDWLKPTRDSAERHTRKSTATVFSASFSPFLAALTTTPNLLLIAARSLFPLAEVDPPRPKGQGRPGSRLFGWVASCPYYKDRKI